MARDWRKSHKNELGDDFDASVTAYLRQHPMFRPDELSDPKKLGALTLPAEYVRDHKKALEWGKAHGLSDDWVRLPSESGRSVEYAKLRAEHRAP